MQKLFSPRKLVATLIIFAVAGLIGAKLVVDHFLMQTNQTVSISFDPNEPVASGTWELWNRQGQYEMQACCPDSTEIIDAPGELTGYARRFSVRVGEPLVRGNHRTELRLRPNPLGEVFMYTIRTYVPVNWQHNPELAIIMQWHGSKDFFIGEQGRSPPLEIGIVEDQYVISKSWDSRLLSNGGSGNVEGHAEIGRMPLDTGRWVTWTILARWSAGEDGFIRIWADDALLANDTGPNAHRDLMGPYLKAGIYVPGWHYVGPRGDVSERTMLVGEIMVRGAGESEIPSFTLQ